MEVSNPKWSDVRTYELESNSKLYVYIGLAKIYENEPQKEMANCLAKFLLNNFHRNPILAAELPFNVIKSRGNIFFTEEDQLAVLKEIKRLSLLK